MSDSNLVDFGDYTDEAAAAEAEDLAASGSEFAKIPVGESVWRILPPAAGKTSPFKTVYQHYIKLPGMERGVSFACPRIHDRRPCPACKKATELKGSRNATDQKMARELSASRRVMANVILRGANGEDKGPLILGFGKQIHEQLNTIRNSKNGGNFCHPIDGFDVVINRKGQGLDTEYLVSAAREDSPLHESVQQMNDWITMQAALDQYALPPSEEDLAEMLSTVPGAAPATRQMTGGRGRRSARTAEDDAGMVDA